jgi:hypothetical protein
MATMKAAVVHAFKEPLKIQEVPVPKWCPAASSSRSWRLVFATPTCTRQTATGLPSRNHLSFPDMKASVSSAQWVLA